MPNGFMNKLFNSDFSRKIYDGLQMNESDSREIRVIFDHNRPGRIFYFILRFSESQHLPSTRNYLLI